MKKKRPPISELSAACDICQGQEVGGVLAQLTSQDRNQAVAEEREGEGSAEPSSERISLT